MQDSYPEYFGADLLKRYSLAKSWIGKKIKGEKNKATPLIPPSTNKHSITNKPACFTHHTTVGHHCFEQRVLWSGLRVNLGQPWWPSPIILSLQAEAGE